MPAIDELIKNSVTKNDEQSYQGGGIVLRFMLPQAMGMSYMGQLPADPPPYWSWERDVILRATVLYESSWANAVGIACSKVSAKSFEVEGDVPLQVKRLQKMMINLDSGGWSIGQSKGARDFLTTDNGEFWEIVKATRSWSSRILGLRHLDSLRCQRTGDSTYPVVYRDLKGIYHALREDQVIHLVDMPNPAAEWFGIGLCAASHSFTHIYKNANIDRYVNEKISGSNPLAIHFVSSISEKSLRSALDSADSESTRKGAVMYKGAVVVPLLGDTPASLVTVPLSELPDRFVRKEEFEISQIQYANSIGLDIQELYPLSSQGFGTGEQSKSLHEKAKGKGLANREKQWTHAIDEKVAADTVTFFFHERDLSDEKLEAEITKIRSDARSEDVKNMIITPQQALQDAVDHNDYPQEFIQDSTQDRTLDDQEKPTDDATNPSPNLDQPVQPIDSKEIARLFDTKESAWTPIVDDYKEDIKRYAAALISNHITRTDYEKLLKTLLGRYALRMMQSVLTQEGISESDLTQDEQSEIKVWIEKQLTFVNGFSDFVSGINSLSGEELTKALEELNRRVEFWGQSMTGVAGIVMGAQKIDQEGTWRLGFTEKHCTTCLNNNGQTRKMSEWNSRGLPQSEKLECNGYNCDCSIDDMNGKQLYPK